MMKAKTVSDLDAVLYSLYLIGEKPLPYDDFKQIVEIIRYYSNKYGASWLACYSTTDSDTAKQTVIRTGKRGRPRKKVSGVKIDAHGHFCIKGTNEISGHTPAHKIAKALNDKYWDRKCRVVSKGPCKEAHAKNNVSYIFQQGDVIRSGGDFDYREYAKNS